MVNHGWATSLKNDGVRQLGSWNSQLNGKSLKIPWFQSPPSSVLITIINIFFQPFEPLRYNQLWYQPGFLGPYLFSDRKTSPWAPRIWRESFTDRQTRSSELTFPYDPWCWYIYLQNWVIFRVNVGKYTRTMEHLRAYLALWNHWNASYLYTYLMTLWKPTWVITHSNGGQSLFTISRFYRLHLHFISCLSTTCLIKILSLILEILPKTLVTLW